MPQALVRCLAAGMDRVMAEEALQQHAVMAAASGSLKRADARRIVRRLRQAAQGRQKAKPATPMALAQMGIAVKLVPAKEARPDG